MEPTSLFSINAVYNLARGPFVWIALGLCIAGTILRTIQFIWLTKAEQRNIRIQKAYPIKQKPVHKFSLNRIYRFFYGLKLTILGNSPVTIFVSCIFHLCLIIAPIFLLAHNILMEESIGFSLFSFPERLTNWMTLIFLICATYFLIRRLLLPRLRSITSFYDYIILFITVAPFLTGFLAYYQLADYKTVIILHMLAGELLLIAIPFTKIYHMVFFFFGRFVLINQHTLGKGSRTW